MKDVPDIYFNLACKFVGKTQVLHNVYAGKTNLIALANTSEQLHFDSFYIVLGGLHVIGKIYTHLLYSKHSETFQTRF